MWEILKLIRFKTVLFTAFAMYTIRYGVVCPLLERNGLALFLPDRDFPLLVFSVCCLLSAAFVINDYFDTKIDRLAATKDVIVGKTVSRRTAIILHSVLNFTAVLLAFILGIKVGSWGLGLLFFFISLLLWLYSSKYKKQYIWGNFIVALMASFIPYAVILFEIPLIGRFFETIQAVDVGRAIVSELWWTVSGFAFFLFLNMWIYEINKDLYTLAGDRDEGIMSFPVRLGERKSCRIILALAGIALLFVFVIYGLFFYPYLPLLLYMVLALLLPYGLYWLSLVRTRNKKIQLMYIELIMVLAIGSCFFISHYLNHVGQ